MELILSGTLKNKVQLNFSANAFYQTIDATNLGLSDKNATFTWNAKLASTVHITPSTFLQINAHYRAKRLRPQGESRPLYLLNLGLRQDLFRDRASLTLTVSDVFKSLKYRSVIDTPVLYREREYLRNSQIVYLGFSWRFGRVVKRKREEMRWEDNI